jgi:hypothetical protein
VISTSKTVKLFLTFCFGASLSLTSAAEDQSTATTATEQTSPSTSRFWAHRLRFLAADEIGQFRYCDTNPGMVTVRDLLYKVSTRVQVNLVGEGTTYLQGRGESGRNFVSSYDFTGVGLNRSYWSFNLKSFFLGQKLGPHFEVQAGGVEFERGAGSEATYADNDGWLEGYRIRFSGAGHHWLPNQVVATVGYVGDFKQPNVFTRLDHMSEENYVQVLATAKLGATREVSAEFDSIQGIRYTREALHWRNPALVLVDDLAVEAITRISDDASFGWSGSLFRSLDRKGRLRSGVFYSDMPKGIFLKNGTVILQNGDLYSVGKRMGPVLRVLPFKNFEVNLFGSSRLDHTPGTRYRGQVTFRYQFADLLNRMLK